MTPHDPTRRRLLRRAGLALSLPAAATLAGCPQPGETVFDQVGEPGSSDGGGSGGPAPPEDPPPVSREPEYDDWFADVDNYRGGTVVYRADRESVDVSVGADGDGGGVGFQQPAIAVAVGTSVRWVWTGRGGEHSVTAVDGDFGSGSPVAERPDPFVYRFTEPGTYRYVCERHEDEGMRGAVSVYDPEG